MRKPGATPQVRRVEELGALKARNAIVTGNARSKIHFAPSGLITIFLAGSRGDAPGFYISRLQREARRKRQAAATSTARL